jgi:universal stress protein A
VFPLIKILCPTDFSEPSFLAIDRARRLAETSGAEIILMHVVPPLPTSPAPSGMHGFDTAAYLEGMLTYGRESMQRLIMEKLPEKVPVRSLILAGNPSDSIISTAEEEQVDLVVIATHGHTGWRRFVFGSVAERVVRLSPCPVLTIPPPGEVKA